MYPACAVPSVVKKIVRDLSEACAPRSYSKHELSAKSANHWILPHRSLLCVSHFISDCCDQQEDTLWHVASDPFTNPVTKCFIIISINLHLQSGPGHILFIYEIIHSHRAVEAHAFNSSTGETEAVGSFWALGQPHLQSEFQDNQNKLHRETLPWKKTNKTNQLNWQKSTNQTNKKKWFVY